MGIESMIYNQLVLGQSAMVFSLLFIGDLHGLVMVYLIAMFFISNAADMLMSQYLACPALF